MFRRSGNQAPEQASHGWRKYLVNLVKGLRKKRTIGTGPMVPFSDCNIEPLYAAQYYYMPERPVDSLPNTPETAVAKIGITITSIKPIAAAMRPYSIAVAPDSSLMNFFM